MGLDLDIDLRQLTSRGRREMPLAFEIVGEVGDADLELLARTTVKGVRPPELKRISERHHALARLLAAGVAPGEAGMIVGYDPSRVSILQNSPAFQDLLALYRKEVDFQFSSMLEHMHGLGMDALIELRERLEDNPDDFTAKELLAIVSDMGDRTGAPKAREVRGEININLGDKLEEARRRARAAVEAQIVDAEVVEEE